MKILAILTTLIACHATAQFTYKYVKNGFDPTYRIAWSKDPYSGAYLKMQSAQVKISTAGEMASAADAYMNSMILALGAKDWARLKAITARLDESQSSEPYDILYGERMQDLELVEKAKRVAEENLGRSVTLFIHGSYFCDEEMSVDAAITGKATSTHRMEASNSNDKEMLTLTYDLESEDYFQDLMNSHTAKFRANESHCRTEIFTFSTANIKAAYAFMTSNKNSYKREKDLTEQQKAAASANGLAELNTLIQKMEKERDSAIIQQAMAEAELKARAERAKRTNDSIQAATKRAKDSTDLANALNEFRQADQSLRKRLADTEENILVLEQLTNDNKKADFIRTTFDMSPNADLAKLKLNRAQLRKGLTRPDTTSTPQLKAATTTINNAVNQYHEDSYQRIVQHVDSYYMIDQDFLRNPMKKTRLYQKNKELYKQKKIDAIQPTKKHITAMYVYGGGKSPLGANLAIYPTNNLGLWAEYLTHGPIEGLTNDNPQDYADPQEAQKLFDQIKQQNLYKLEDTWDKSYQTINVGVNLPFNYKKNLILGIGAGKSITTEHRRFSVPDDFYPNSTYRQPNTNNGNFYLDSERRTSSNMNFSANLTLILKPLTIKIGANINDRDRRDTRINIGIGLTF